MNCNKLALCILLPLLAGNAYGQAGGSDEELDIDIFIVDETSDPEDVVNRIALPVIELQAQLGEPGQGEDVPGVEDTEIERIVEDAADSLTEKVRDTIGAGNLDELPDEVIDVLPVDAIDALVDDGLLADPISPTLDAAGESLQGVDAAVERLLEDNESLEQVLELEGSLTDSALDPAAEGRLPEVEIDTELLDASGIEDDSVDQLIDELDSDAADELLRELPAAADDALDGLPLQ